MTTQERIESEQMPVPEKYIPAEWWQHKHRGVFLVFLSAPNKDRLERKVEQIRKMTDIIKLT